MNNKVRPFGALGVDATPFPRMVASAQCEDRKEHLHALSARDTYTANLEILMLKCQGADLGVNLRMSQ